MEPPFTLAFKYIFYFDITKCHTTVRMLLSTLNFYCLFWSREVPRDVFLIAAVTLHSLYIVCSVEDHLNQWAFF